MHGFQRLLAAELVSNFGSMLSRLAIPWLAALTLNATPWQMGWLLAADVAAGALGSLALGAMVDRRSPRAVMLWADGLRAVLLAALAAAAAMQALTMALLVAAAATGGLLTMAFELARSAWMARQLAASDLVKRNAQMAIGSSLSETAAFALGGWLFQGLGAALALVVDALSYLGSALLLRGVSNPPAVEAPARARSPEPPRGIGMALSARTGALLTEMRQGLRAIAASPTLRRLAGIEVLLALSSSLFGTSYMIYVTRDIGFATGVLGLIFATGALGSLAGGALAEHLGQRLGAWRTMAWGLGAATLGALCVPLAGAATLAGAAWLVAHQVVGDAGQTLHQVHERTLRQTNAAPALLARVDGALRCLGLTTQLLGALAGGALAGMIGTRAALSLAAVLIAMAALAAALPRE